MSSTTNGVLPASATDERKIHETLIVGSGPAGFTAGLYAARANLNPILFTGQEYGGQVSLTFEIENYPGFPEALGGPELVERMKAQAERFGLQVEFDFVTAIDADAHPYTLRTETGRTYRTRSVIAATGARPRFLGIPGEKEMTGKGVSYCATCDGFFFRDKDVVVVGGGDSALEEGLFLTKFASRVRIIHRRDELRASQILQKRARSHDKIEFVLNTVVTRIHADADASVAGIDVQDTQNGATGSLDTDGVFIFVGTFPTTNCIGGTSIWTKKGIWSRTSICAPTCPASSRPGKFRTRSSSRWLRAWDKAAPRPCRPRSSWPNWKKPDGRAKAPIRGRSRPRRRRSWPRKSARALRVLIAYVANRFPFRFG